MKLLKVLRFFSAVLPKLDQKEIYFVFPFYHLGGAETVHRDIMHVFRNQKTVCLITNKSENTLHKSAFSKWTRLVEIYPFLKSKKIRNLALKHIARKINQVKNPVVFGCNSHFFYDLIPHLHKHVKIIDLIHAFSYEEPYAAEQYSLAQVDRIDQRVILGAHTFNDFKTLYQKHGIGAQFLERLCIIRNKVEGPQIYPDKPSNSKLKILFVGRNGYEKRPELFFKIAEQALKEQLNCEFIVIGFWSDRPLLENTAIIGELTKSELDRYYLHSDLLLITSSREGFPMVVLEGMSFGVVPICTNVGEIKSFINKENDNGFLISNSLLEENMVAEFISRIKSLQTDRTLLARTSKNAYQSVQENFGARTFAENYRTLFRLKK